MLRNIENDTNHNTLQTKLVGFDLAALWMPKMAEQAQLQTVVGLVFCWHPCLSLVGELMSRAVGPEYCPTEILRWRLKCP